MSFWLVCEERVLNASLSKTEDISTGYEGNFYQEQFPLIWFSWHSEKQHMERSFVYQRASATSNLLTENIFPRGKKKTNNGMENISKDFMTVGMEIIKTRILVFPTKISVVCGELREGSGQEEIQLSNQRRSLVQFCTSYSSHWMLRLLLSLGFLPSLPGVLTREYKL